MEDDFRDCGKGLESYPCLGLGGGVVDDEEERKSLNGGLYGKAFEDSASIGS